MAYDSGFSRRSASEREIQPVAIVSVDPDSRTAIGVTRVRSRITINCSYATGDTITTPATGEQWYCERFDMEWRLYGRIPFNDPTLNIKPEEGQVSVGSARGPLELNGPEVRINSKVFRLNGVYYRDSGTALERSTDQVTWTAVSAATASTLAQELAAALAGYQGTDNLGALSALKVWSGLLQTVVDNFSQFWNLLCDNSFITGLKGLGFGDTDLAKIIDGFQNFLNYLFSTVFCDFNGDLTPQVLLARIRDLLSPLTENPFVLGLQQIAQILGVNIGNLLNDAVEGATGLMKLIFDLIFCNWDSPELAKIPQIIKNVTGSTAFGPAVIVSVLEDLFGFFRNNVFVREFVRLATVFSDNTGIVIKDIIGGLQRFVKIFFDLIFCNWDAIQSDRVLIDKFINQVSQDLSGIFGPVMLLEPVKVLFDFLANNIFVKGLVRLIRIFGENTGLVVVDVIKGLQKFMQILFDVIFCNLAAIPGDFAKVQQFLTESAAEIANAFGPASIINAINDFYKFFTDNPFINGLRHIWTVIFGNTPESFIKDAVNGATEFVKLVFGILTCDPTQLARLLTNFANLVPGIGTPQAILSTLADLVTKLLNNPLITAIQTFAADYLGLTGTLLQQIITGTGSLFNWFFKALTTFLPFVPWQALLPFLDWTAINNATVPGINWPSLITTNLFNMFDGLFTGLLGSAAGAFKNFITNLGVLFNGMGLLSGNFNLVEGVEFLLTEVLGIATRGLDGVLQFGGTIVSSVLGAVGDFFENIAAFFGFDLTKIAKDALTPLQMAALFLKRIEEALLAWITSFVFGGHNTLLEWAQTNVIGPIVGNFLKGLGIDPAKYGIQSITDIATVGLGVLGDIAGTLLTKFSQIPANLVQGVLPPAVIGSIPVSNIADTSPNLITLGKFADTINIEANDGWVWDSTQNAPQSSGGSAKVTISSAKNRYLYSRQAVPVGVGDRLVVTASVKTNAVAVSPFGSTPISIAIIPFVGNDQQPTIIIGNRIQNSADWTTIGNTSLVPYVVTDSSWTTVMVRLGVDSTATSGVVWWDDISLKKTGGLIQGNVDRLNDAWNGVIGGLKNGTSPTTGNDWTNLFDAASEARGRAETGVTNAGTAQTTADGTIDGVIQGITGTTTTGNPYTAVKDAVGGLSDFTQGTTQSGVNLVVDPKASYNRLWMQSGLSVSSLFCNSTSTSLRFAADGTARTFQWTINNIGNIVPITAQAGKVYYCECYVYLPDANPTTTATVTMYAQGTVLPATSYPSDISPMVTGAGFTAAGTWSYTTLTNPAKGAWNRLYGYFTVPAGRDGFTAGIRFTAAASHYVHVDDMVIYDVTESVNTNNKLYGRPTPADTIATASVPTGIPAGNILNSSGTGNIGSEVSGLSSTVSGQAGTISGLQTTTSGLTTTTTNTINNVVWGLRGVPPGTNYTTNDILTWFQQFNQTLFRTNTPTLGSSGTINSAAVPPGMSRDKILNLNSDLTSAVDNAGNAINGVGYLQTSLLTGYTVQTYTGSTTWTKPADLSELYVVLFGAGGTGATGNTYTGSSPPSTVAGGAGGTRGRLVATQIDLSLMSGVSSVAITIGSTASPTTSFGSIVNSAAAYANYVATPLGLMTSSSLPGNGGAGGTVDNINQVAGAGVTGDTTSTGVVGGSGGAGRDLFASGTYYGNNGSAGFNGALYANLSQSGGSGGGGGGSIRRGSAYSGVIYGGNGGSGGLPGGGGGGGGAASGGGAPYGGSGGAGGNGLVIIAYKLAKKTA